MSRQITFTVAALFAGTLAFVGTTLVLCAAFDIWPRGAAWVGFALIIGGATAWTHDRLNRAAERIANAREDVAFDLGRLAAAGRPGDHPQRGV